MKKSQSPLTEREVLSVYRNEYFEMDSILYFSEKRVKRNYYSQDCKQIKVYIEHDSEEE